MTKHQQAEVQNRMRNPAQPAAILEQIDPQSVMVVARILGMCIAGLAEASGWKTLESQQQLLLLTLFTLGECSQNTLEKHTGVEKSSVSRNVKRLGEGVFELKKGAALKTLSPGLGWVESFRDPMDQRNSVVRLTPVGRAQIEQVMQRAARLLHISS